MTLHLVKIFFNLTSLHFSRKCKIFDSMFCGFYCWIKQHVRIEKCDTLTLTNLKNLYTKFSRVCLSHRTVSFVNISFRVFLKLKTKAPEHNIEVFRLSFTSFIYTVFEQTKKKSRDIGISTNKTE